MKFEIESLEEYATAAQSILDNYENESVFLLRGKMGAGKTTFVQSLIKHLNSFDQASSPTFGIVNEYHYPKGKIYHFDCYRLKSIEEAEAMGMETYLNSGEYCFIEWPENIEELLPESFVIISIETEEDKRIINASLFQF